MARLNECILYRNFEHGEILDKMAELMNAWEQKVPDLKDKEGMFFECANGLLWLFRKSVALLSDISSGK
jgi:hypothetical protein